MNIGFEGKRVFANFTGLGNYSRFVVDALSKYYPENRYFLYTPHVRSHRDVNPIIHRENISVIKPEGLFSRPLFSSLWRSWGLSGHESTRDLSIFHGLSQELPVGLPSNVKKIVTVHDLIFLRYPQFYNRLDAAIYLRKVKMACASADAIIAISEQTAADIVAFLKVDSRKIKVVYQGCHQQFKQALSAQDIQIIKSKYGLPDHYNLNVGTIEERKNLEVIIRSMALTPEASRIPLVVVGRATRYLARIMALVNQHELSPWITFVHQADFQDFPAIYQGAGVFIYPSRFEGFGIPVVEAIASGIPVITSKGSCMKEAAGPHAVYVDPEDPEDLAHSVQVVSADSTKRSEMIKSSAKFIERFEPDQIAARIMDVYLGA